MAAIFARKPLSISSGNVWPLSQMSTNFLILSFCAMGADETMSFINTGISSVTRRTPAANVPSAASSLAAWPDPLARSSHFLVTESTT
jgi:hypothetical protein